MVKKLLSVLTGETAAVPPVWLMRQAGRYLPEYRALRANAKDFIRFCLSPELAVEVTLQPVRRFDLDAAILFADILLVPHALGQKVWFVEGEGPRLEAVRDGADLERLIYRAELLAPVMQTIKGVRAALPDRAALIGFAGSPWTVATYMIEGAGGTDHETARKLAWTDSAFFARLMDVHWQRKKQRSGGMSNPKINEWYDLAMANGALGGKLIGAGGGGFLMFYADDRAKLRQAMRQCGLKEVRFRFDFEGTKLVIS